MDTEWMSKLCSHVYPLCPNENKHSCFYWYIGKLATEGTGTAWILIVALKRQPWACDRNWGVFCTKELGGRTVLTAGLCHRQVIRLSNSTQIWGVAANVGRTLKKICRSLEVLIAYVFCFLFQVAIKAWRVEEFLATAFELKLQVCGQYFYCLFCLNKWTVPSE